MVGRFEGELCTRWLDDGRQMQLIQPFAFHDDEGGEWQVPSGAQTDGASIPRALWTLIGGPFEGPYRKPAVVHDWFCDVRSRDWRAVHRMFYASMICAGVKPAKAKTLYLGVLIGGPRWTVQAMHNSRLALNRYDDNEPRMYSRAMSDPDDEVLSFELDEEYAQVIENLAAQYPISEMEVVADSERTRLTYEHLDHFL